MHKNALFLFKNCKNAKVWGLRPKPSPPNEKSWLRHWLGPMTKFEQFITWNLPIDWSYSRKWKIFRQNLLASSS